MVRLILMQMLLHPCEKNVSFLLGALVVYKLMMILFLGAIRHVALLGLT